MNFVPFSRDGAGWENLQNSLIFLKTPGFLTSLVALSSLQGGSAWGLFELTLPKPGYLLPVLDLSSIDLSMQGPSL